jgi:RNA polymerase sigma factor for flagellar operon FliA
MTPQYYPPTPPPGAGPTPADQREQLILAHIPRVRNIARGIRQRLPESVSLDDLVSTGVLGLIAAIDRFDETHHVKLTTYAEYKIRGAILDSLRSLDWAPRQSRRRAKQVKKAIAALEQRFGRSPDEEEIAGELGLTLNEYHGWLVATTGLEMESLETVQDSAACTAQHNELRVLLNVAIAKLPDMERLIVRLHCYEQLPSREIAARTGLSESRVSQLKSRAIERLQSQATIH